MSAAGNGAAAAPAPLPKVVRIITRLNIGGPAIHALLLTARLDGYQPLLVCGQTADGEGDMGYLAEALGVEPVIIPSLGRELSALDDLRTLWAIYQLLRRERPAIVHTHMAKAGTLGRVAALLARVPHRLHTFHGHVFHGYFSPLKSRLFLLIEQVLARLSSRIITISQAQREELTRRFAVAPDDHIELIELGFDLGPFARSATLRGELRRELGVGPATRLVGIVGRMVPIKDHDFFVRAMALVARHPALADDQALRLVFIGGGELEDEVKAAAARAGLAGRSHFLGWRRDLPRLYADLDVVALTSKNEGTPVALIETLASGGAAVCSVDIGGVADVLGGGRLGVLVKERTPEAFATTLTDLLLDDVRRAALARAGQEATLARYGADRLRRDVASLYDRLLARRA